MKTECPFMQIISAIGIINQSNKNKGVGKMKKKGQTIIVMAGIAIAFAGCGNAENTSAVQTQAQADANGNYLVNGSFEEPDFTGWNITNIDNVTEELDIYTRETDCYEGVQSLHFYSKTNQVNFTAEQTVSGLEEGSYKLVGHIQGEASGDSSAYFYAVVNGETVKTEAVLGGYVNWYTAELSGIQVTDGELTIGVSVATLPGGWGTIDDITLVKE